jgi:hypothetical protein
MSTTEELVQGLRKECKFKLFKELTVALGLWMEISRMPLWERRMNETERMYGISIVKIYFLGGK